MRLPASRFAVALSLILVLTAFNLCFRLSTEPVAQWDESIYATSALEMVETGELIGTTFNGALDYYNSKPPLNVWIIAAAFKVAGTNLVAMRTTSVIAAWLTVLVLVLWARRFTGDAIALLAGLVLATSFGFIHLHSGRSANPDALMSLLLLLVVVVATTFDAKPWRLAWLGPLLAGVFLLKGMAVLLPLVFLGVTGLARLSLRKTMPWKPVGVAAVLLIVPTAAWAVARWRLDEARFLQLLFTQDLLWATTRALDGHAGPWLYYPNIIQRYQYDWVVAAIVAAAVSWPEVRRGCSALVKACVAREGPAFTLTAWACVLLAVITAMQTKLPWYVNPLYPAFSLAVAWLIWTAVSSSTNPSPARRRSAAAMAVVALLVAEGKLTWHTLEKRQLEGTVQGLIMNARDGLAGKAVFRAGWPRDDAFVVRAIGQARPVLAYDATSFLELAAEGDVLVADADLLHPSLERLQVSGRHAIFRRR